MVRRAADLGRKRGTVSGLELALQLQFPDVPLRIEDQGGVKWSLDQQPVEAPPPSFVVYCDKPIPEQTQAAVARDLKQMLAFSTSENVGLTLEIRDVIAQPVADLLLGATKSIFEG